MPAIPFNKRNLPPEPLSTPAKVIDDVDKLDHIDDGFVHYQLLRFCQATRLQYLNSHVSLDNQLVMQQQHVDYKIAEALLNKGTNNAHPDMGP